MKRGELWIGSSHSDYGGKPRPVLVVQRDGAQTFNSVIACPLTSINIDAHALRFQLDPDDFNGLKHRSWIMVDKITAYERPKISRPIGALTTRQLELIDASLVDVLGLVR